MATENNLISLRLRCVTPSTGQQVEASFVLDVLSSSLHQRPS